MYEEQAMSTVKTNWRSSALGTPAELDLPGGRLRCFQAGKGPAIVFVHGLLVNGNLWRKVVERLAPAFHCVTLDLPLGSHELPLGPGADLTPPALAGLVLDAVEALGVDDATLVGNDTGGALCQIAVTERPDRIGRLVLTSCDYRENFPPREFRMMVEVARRRGGLRALLTPMRVRAARRLPMAYGRLTRRPIEDDACDSYVMPALESAAVRDDLRRVLLGLDTAHTVRAADRLPAFDRPALIAWSREDAFFPPADAEALAAALPDARLEWIDDARTFSPEDRPDRLAELIDNFVGQPRPATTSGDGRGTR
jgi:pimeloyl-ACP methyl ester carboxylesterase